MSEDRFRTMGAGEIADLLDKNELDGRDYFNCVYRAMVLLREQAQTEAAKPAVPDDLVELLRELRPNYGDVGSRDVDVAEKQRKIDAAIALLSAAPPLPVAQGVPDIGAIWEQAICDVEAGIKLAELRPNQIPGLFQILRRNVEAKLAAAPKEPT